ncbi:MAG TPA: NAD(P)(+) transhydrogenase (Re/Si-specific) subunit beta [Clostridiaceae bacterium]|nr:NAD(P)(+) transhydrogenase (Re/Si-specific) subunit beta [Clostridiaceae bacterium]
MLSIIDLTLTGQKQATNIIPNMDPDKQILYLIIAGLLVILVMIGISMMSKVNLAVKGNLLGSLSMAMAIVLTLWAFDILTVVDLWIAMLIGTLLGMIISRRVTMLQMPQMVGLLNGFGGAASMIAGALTLINPGSEDPFSVITAGLAIFVGSLTFTGSVVAAAKLEQLITQKPIILKRHQLWTGLSALLGLVGVFLFLNQIFTSGIAEISMILATAIISGLFGIFFAIRIGGADMPIAISLLNSFSGVAGSIAGLAISDPLLVAVGGIVGASGLLLTQIMCRSMNRKLVDILLGKTSTPAGKKEAAPAAVTRETASIEEGEEKIEEDEKPDNYLDWLRESKRVIIVPGYGMALSQAQEVVKTFSDLLGARGITVDFAIHPVAGRMPGHMNVLLAEVDIPYDKLREMNDINDDFPEADVAVIIGANDVVNPAANTEVGTPIYGMPILDVESARHLIIMNYDNQPGYAGVDNPLYKERRSKVALLFGDAKASLEKLVSDLSE